MIKTVLIGLWVCAASLGSSYVAATLRGASGAESHAPTYFAGLDWRKTDGITVPILADEGIAGYVLARFVYTIDGAMAEKLKVPPDPFILNDVFAALYETSDFDFRRPEKYDLEALKATIKENVNKRYGETVVHEILVEQFDFLPKDDMIPKSAALE